MDGYQFVASLVQSIASLGWPIAIVLAVWLFRDQLIKLLPLLRVKHKDWEASFRLEEAEREAADWRRRRPSQERCRPRRKTANSLVWRIFRRERRSSNRLVISKKL